MNVDGDRSKTCHKPEQTDRPPTLSPHLHVYHAFDMHPADGCSTDHIDHRRFSHLANASEAAQVIDGVVVVLTTYGGRTAAARLTIGFDFKHVVSY